MDAWTFRKRITVAALALLTLAVGFDVITGAEYLAALLRIVGS